jgi:DNA-binding response OmpR family regulator
MYYSSMKKILVVEDDTALSALYRTELELKKYEVIEVSDGAKAVETIKSEKPDLVLLDLMLPNKNGLEILQEIRADDEIGGSNVVMLTNFGDEENVSTALEHGALDYIMKYKIVPSELSDKLASILGDSQDSVVKVTS